LLPKERCIYLDNKALGEDLNPVTSKPWGMRLGDFLELALEPGGLDYCERFGQIYITNAEKAARIRKAQQEGEPLDMDAKRLSEPVRRKLEKRVSVEFEGVTIIDVRTHLSRKWLTKVCWRLTSQPWTSAGMCGRRPGKCGSATS